MYLLSLLITIAVTAGDGAVSKSADKAGALDKKLGDGPVDFRCDNMFVYTKPNRSVCRKNVIIRRGDMLVCCELFEGQADDNWAWQGFTCRQNVRAQRGSEIVWADKAEFLQQSSDLVLTGNPLLHRGDSILEGERVTMNVREDRARVLKPRGRMEASDGKKVPLAAASVLTGTLPATCPIPTVPR